MSFEPFGVTLMQMNFLNMAMALDRWDDLNMHDCLARTEGKAGLSRSMHRDLLCVLLYSALYDLYD